jgi:hypothetical protein
LSSYYFGYKKLKIKHLIMPIPQAFNFIGENPPFQTLSPKDVEAASEYLEKEMPAWIESLSAIPDAEKTFENIISTLLSFTLKKKIRVWGLSVW